MSKSEVDAAIAAVETSIAWWDTWVLVFTLMVAIGVGGELFVGVAHWLKSRELKPLREAQARIHEKDIADTFARAKEAGKGAAEAA